MNAVFEAEKALGRMAKDVGAQRGLGYDIESIDEVNTGRNAPHRFRLALVSVEDDRASAPGYVSGVDSGLPGFGDKQSTKNLQQLLAAGRAPH